jgi:hypothetical protein
MDNTIFLLTLQKNLERVLFDSIPIKYKVNIVSKNNLMVELYKKSPTLLIVDLDSITEQILEMIQSIVALSYLPVVYICTELDYSKN